MKNTEINYLYRDACNYKNHNREIVRGVITKEQIETIMNCLEERKYFIPSQVGLPETRFETITSEDHCWFELGEDDFRITESEEITIVMSVNELVECFLAAKGKWDESLFIGYDKEKINKNRRD